MKKLLIITTLGFFLFLLSISIYFYLINRNLSSKLTDVTKDNTQNIYLINIILQDLIENSQNEIFGLKFSDYITLPPSGDLYSEMKTYREFTIAFEIFDKSKSPNDMRELIETSNVMDVSYCVFRSDNNDPTLLPIFDFENIYFQKNLNTFKPNSWHKDNSGNKWEFILSRELNLDVNNTISQTSTVNGILNILPVYPLRKQISIGPLYDLDSMRHYRRIEKFDSLFYYDSSRTINYNNGKINKRIFKIVFEPPFKDGWYKLRVFSKTNRVLSYSKHLNRELGLEYGFVRISDFLLKNHLQQLYKLLNNTDIPDYRKYEFIPHDDTNVNQFLKDIERIERKLNLHSGSQMQMLIRAYKNIAEFVLSGSGSIVKSIDKNYIDLNIYVQILGRLAVHHQK